MKTKVSSDNNGEGVPPQTTVVTTTVGQSSVWSICDISTDSHVELRDITPSISPVFTDDQVHELTQNSSEVDVLGEHFLPPEAIKQIDEVLSSQAQGNLLYSDPVLGNALKQNHDVLLPGDLGFHGTMFPSFDSIVEADRILNKRDESADAISSEGNDTAADQTSSAVWSKDGTAVNTPAGDSGTDGGDSSGTEKGPRRSMRKRVQVKKDSETLKTVLPASKPVSRGKDISKLKYANNKEEAPKKEVRRSGRMQKKVDKGENSADTEEKESNVNSKKQNITIDKEAEKETLEQQDSASKNVRRSPRTQKKSPVEEKKNTSRKQDDKKEANTSSDGKESCEEKASDKESKSKGTKSKGSEKTNKKGSNDGDVTGSDKDEKKGVRKSGRTTRQKNEEEEKKVDNENNKEDAKKGKGKTEGKKIEEAKNIEDSEIKVTEKNLSEKDESKKGANKSVADEKPEKSDNPRTQGKEEDSKTKAIGRKKVELKTESSEDESVVKTRRVSRRNERQERKDTEENIAGKSSEEETKSAASLKENAVEAQDTIKQEDKADKESSDEKENIKKVVQEEVTTSAVKDEKASKESKKVGKKVSSGDVEQSKEEEDGDSDENSVDDNEEFNEDSDYDPEYDPDRLWCVCRKPHGNRFMICCDHCEDWFHGMCVGITMAQGRQMEKDGQEYVCPKCQAKVEEEMKEKNKETKPKTENVAKGKEETYKHSEAKEGRKSPSKHGHHKRKEHSVKIKIPFEKDDTRKRRHSTHRRSQDDEHSGSKKSKESDRAFTKEHTSEEKKKKQPESKGFRIPKKVRTTPTPASYIHHPTRKMCITAGCSMLAEHYSLYCSPECVQKHAEESLKIILDEKKKRMGYKQPVSSSKNVVSPTSSLLGPVPWDHNSAPNLSQSESAPKEGIAVIERSTGRVIAGVAAPTQEELLYWLQDHPTFEVLRPAGAKDDKKKEKKEDSEKSIRDNIRKSLKDILTLRSKEQQDLSVSEEKIIKCSLDVEGEMFSFFGDTGHRYKNKYRSLMFNLKDPRNKVLFRHVLLGEITVDRLVRMTPEQLASPELATWREQETKHTLEMIKQNQEEINATKAHTKKTHKGEVEIDDDDLSTLENSVKANAELKEEQKLPDSNTGSSSLLLDTTDEHRMHLFDLNCRICTGKMLPPGEPPRRETPSPLVSTTSIVQAVAESSIPSPTPMDIVTSANSPDSATVSQPPVSPSVLNKTTKKVPAVWKGFVMMQSVAKFGTSAYCVSGSCDDLLQLLPDTLHIQGRIAHEQVWDYLLQLKSSTSREVCVIRYEASSDDEKLSYVSLYSYFYSRKRCGVVSNCYTGVKDMYLVPLASHQPIPPELLPFDGPGLDEPRPHMLLGVIVRSKAVFKRPRALSQRSMSPPPKRRTSSASVETNSSDGGVSDSPASKRETLRELRDSPPADIDDIVFQYHTSQAKKTASESKDSSVKASPASESSTPSVSSSTGISSAVSNEKSSLPSLEAQKQQLLDLQERARQYILAQTQKKTASSNGKQGVEKEQSGSLEVVSVDQQAGVGGTADDDAPYDPEEGLDLDLTDITPSKPSVTTEPVDPVKPLEPAKPLEPTKSVNTATPVDSAKPSSLEILVSTLQRLQGTAPQLSAASAFLPKASISILQPMNPAAREHQSSSSSDIVSHSSTTSGHGQAKSEELSIPHLPVATAGRLHSSSVSSAQGPHFSPSSDHRLYPGLQPGPSSNQRLHPAPSSDQRPQLRNASDQRVQPGPTDHRPQPGPTVDQRLHPAPSSDQRPQSRHPSDQRVQPGPTDHRPKPGPTVDQRPQPRHPSDQRVQPGPTDHRPQPGHIVDQRLQHGNSSDQRAPFGPSTDQRTQPHPDRWNPSEPPQVTRQVNNVTQDVEQYSGLRPEERARLAARESRLGSRENRRVSSDHRDPHYDQRRIDDRHRPGWHNDPRYHRDSRDSRDDSRRNWRDDYRQGRPWYSDEQRRDRHDHPPRHEDRREERRFKEHWNRDRWRR